MNRTNQAWVSMLRTLLLVFTNFPEAVKRIPALTDGVAKLDTNFKTLAESINSFFTVSSGKTAEKRSLRDELLRYLFAFTGSAFPFAFATRNEKLLALMSRAKSAWVKLADETLIGQARAVVSEVEPYADQLAAHAITPQTITDMKSRIDAFAAAIASQREGYVYRKNATTTIPELIKAIKDDLENTLDPYAESLAMEFPAFYIAYKEARRRLRKGVRHVKTAAPAPVAPADATASRAAAVAVPNAGVPTPVSHPSQTPTDGTTTPVTPAPAGTTNTVAPAPAVTTNHS